MDSTQEQRFVHHLFTRIKNELTGRGVDEIVGDGPRLSRTLVSTMLYFRLESRYKQANV